MAKSNTRLELTWIGKENRPKLEPRVLIPDVAATLVETNPYERNVFVTMPFRQNQSKQFENIKKILRRELKRRGLRACLVIDRELNPDLWGNIVA